jgi:ABC-type transport system substrate-binding protein
VKDTYTIQMNLTAPYAAFLSTLATVEPAGIMEAAWIQAHGGVSHYTPNPYIKRNTMGTGPYCLSSADWVTGSQMTLRQNTNYWRTWHGTEPKTVVMKFTTDPTSRVEAIRTGAADVADLPLSSVSQVSGISGVVAKANETVKSEIVAMNTTNPYMANNASGRLVRQAFSYAFDYNATIANDYAGFASLLPGPIPKGMAYFSVESQVYYQNLVKANALLDQAGYTKNAQSLRFGGYAFRIVADGTQIEEANAARRFQTTLQGIGVQTNLIIEPSTSQWDTARSSATFDFFVAHWVLDYLDADDYVSPMVMNATNGGDYWHTGWNNFTENHYGFLARSEQNAVQRAADYAQVWQASMANPNMIWFCQQDYVPIHQSYVQNFFFNPVTWYNFYFYQKT